MDWKWGTKSNDDVIGYSFQYHGLEGLGTQPITRWLMLVYDEEGLGAAQAWLERTGRRDDQRFAALVEAAIRAIPRVRQKDELIRPEARVLESMRQTLFPSIEPPADPTPPAEQLVLETA